MKKLMTLAALLLTLALCFSLCACGGNGETPSDNDGQKNEQNGENNNNNNGGENNNNNTANNADKKPSEGLEFTSNGDGTCMVSKIGTCEDTALVIPSKSPSGDKVTALYEYAFSGCSKIKSVYIPEGVTEIQDSVFHECSALETVELPSTLERISHTAFERCTNLQYTTYDNAKYLGNSTNKHVALMAAVNTDITSCTINADTKVLAGYAFQKCAKLTALEIPNGIKTIPFALFSGCKGLTSFTVPSHITKIEGSAFSGCSYLKNVVIPDSVTSIGNGIFHSCASLEKVSLSKNITEIPENCFRFCKELKDVRFNGTDDQWKALNKGTNWKSGAGDFLIACISGNS